MKLKLALILLLAVTSYTSQAQLINPDVEKVKGGELTIQPITHATLVLAYKGKSIYIDPTGGADAFKGLAAPDVILITDTHGDHFDVKTIEAIITAKTTLVAPEDVAAKLPASVNRQNVIILKNGDKSTLSEIVISAVPMYNLPGSDNANYHIKGRGNGYVLTIGGKNIYISGDTADTPEMRGLKNIDIAFVCMNLPYTMDVNAAAAGVIAFKPKAVYPYHYRGQDVEKFKALVNEGNKAIEVRLRNWYPKNK